MYKEIKQLKKYLTNRPDELIELYSLYSWCETIEELVFNIKNDVTEKPICEYNNCDIKKSYSKYNKSGYSNGCKKHAKKVSFIKKYGVENPFQDEKIKDKIKQTNLEKYGVENPMKSQEVQDKIKQTNLEKYGVENPFQDEKIKDKIKQTNLEKYGVCNISQSMVIKEKKETTLLRKYGVSSPLKSLTFFEKSKNTKLKRYNDPYFNNRDKAKETIIGHHGVDSVRKIANKEFWSTLNIDELIDELKINTVTYIAKKYNISFTTIYNIVKSEGVKLPSYYTNEEVLFAYLNDKTKLRRNDRKILNGKELDLVCEDKKIAIEINGNYWHSVEQGKNKSYHLNKTLGCLKKGIILIHFFEDEIVYKLDMVYKLLDRLLTNEYYENISIGNDNDIDDSIFKYEYSLTYHMINQKAKSKIIYSNEEPIGILNYEIDGSTLTVYDYSEFGDKKTNIHNVVQLINNNVKTLVYYQDRRFIDYNIINNDDSLNILEIKEPKLWSLSNNYLERSDDTKISGATIYDVGIIKFEKEI